MQRAAQFIPMRQQNIRRQAKQFVVVLSQLFGSPNSTGRGQRIAYGFNVGPRTSQLRPQHKLRPYWLSGTAGRGLEPPPGQVAFQPLFIYWIQLEEIGLNWDILVCILNLIVASCSFFFLLFFQLVLTIDGLFLKFFDIVLKFWAMFVFSVDFRR